MAKNTVFSKKTSLNVRGNLISLDVPKIMGILNITPDSFYAESRSGNIDLALAKAEQMVKDGATLLDVGGYSSRPGAKDISEQEEIKRVAPIIEALRKEFDKVYISVDTFRSGVAKHAVEAGADIINDISGGELDKEMFNTVTDLKVPYILMHMKGSPQTMTSQTNYENILQEMLDYFQKKVDFLLKRGVSDLILDPGFGFAKTVGQNYHILKNLSYFNMLSQPLLVGLSRKSMVYKTLGLSAEEALNGTTILNTIAVMNGAGFLRVHDVKEAMEIVKLYELTYTIKE